LKQVIFSILFILSFGLRGQTVLVINPATSSVSVKSTDLDVAAKANLKNTTKDTIIVKWTRKIDNITQGWSSAVCDKNFCYIPTVDSMRLILAPGESSNMDIHVYPGGISGSAKVSLSIEQIGKPDTRINATYLFNQSTPIKSDDKDAIQLYPNPTQDYFMVNSSTVIGKIELYNITGEKAKVYYAYKNKRYYIDDIPSGIYMVRLFNLQEEILKTVILKKR
jgi:Secretion system C-terminal sorting domain